MLSMSRLSVFASLGLAVGIYLIAAEGDPPTDADRQAAKKLFDDGNFKDAYETYRKLALHPKSDRLKVGQDLTWGVEALRRLGRLGEVDEFRESSIAAHGENWRLLQAAAQSYFNGEHWGFIVAGKFERGNRRGGGRYVNSYPHDRVRGLQLMDQALKFTRNEEDKGALGQFYLTFASNIMYGGGADQGWRMQVLTDLTQLPDYEDGNYYYGGGTAGAPADPEGNPIFTHLILPENYAAAQSDGQRWRWMLAQAAEANAGLLLETRTQLANFLRQQYDVQTLAYYGRFFMNREDEDKAGRKSTYSLHTLGEDETIAKLATGVKRFKLPDEFNFIKIYQEVAGKEKSTWGEQALNALAQLFTDRRQYPKSAEYWKKSIEQYGAGQNNWKQQQLDQIIGNWGMYDNIGVLPAGKKATVEYVFRNGKRVDFEAFEIKVPKLLDDVKAYLKSAPKQVDWQKTNIQNIGYLLVEQNQQQYIGEKVAAFGQDLEPREAHFDRRITIDTPLEKAGAYLLVGKMANGNTSRIILWLADTVIAKKPLEGRTLYFVADAVTGKPLPKCNVEFFGWQVKNLGNNQYQVQTQNFAEFTDNDGQLMPGPQNMPQEYQWLSIARAKDGHFGFLGFTNVWYNPRHDADYNATKVIAITDRPVYRPDNPVKFKLWIRKSQYDQEDVSDYAHQSFNVQINNPKGEQVYKQTLTTDAFGGLEGEYTLPHDATLGQYGIFIVDNQQVHGGGNFRVEEYKKPEFEVTLDAPKEPVMLGEKITATINAKYFFGAPVVNAKVKYKVLRTSYSEQWYPLARWDWFYGRGYWWFAYDYPWYPGWLNWGCKRPYPIWWGVRHEPPEVVAESEAPIGPNGKLEVTFDTAIAKEIHPDQDHSYAISAEVTDASRRTIVGTGNVLVARKAFKVFTWVDRGYYRTGDAIRASFDAHTLDNKPVKGTGKLILYRVEYEDEKPVEKAVEEWNLDTNDQGTAQQQIKAAQPGQYRLSYTVTDSKKHAIEGGYVFVIRGKGFDGKKYRFNDIELITEKREYAPGETVRLMINTEQANSTVLLFVRPANGVYLPPKVLRLDGKSAVEDVAVVKKDMPNFFVEAVTVADGKVYTETKEIVVPPETRVLNVQVTPSTHEYKPGELAKMNVKLTDSAGKPFVGSTVLTVYDKSVEYISGGSNVPEIREFFWKWRRQHYPQTEHNLAWYFNNLVKSGETGMSFLGVFGASVADEAGQGGFGGELVRRGAESKRKAESSLRSMNAAPGAPQSAKAAMARDGVERQQAAGQDRAGFMADKLSEAGEAGPGGAGAELVQPTIRKNFADTAYWIGTLNTEKDGTAKIEFKMPEQLTGWKVRTWAMGHGTKVGQAEADVVTRKNLLVRMQAPRFFVETDEVVLSANVHNYLKTDKQVEVTLEYDGDQLASITDRTQKVLVKADGETRVDWRVKVAHEGQAVVRMKALTDEESDAMEMRFPVYVHGMLKTESYTGVLRLNDNAGTLTFKVPEQRRINETRLEVRYSPTLAGAMVDALPYLVDYPYDTTDASMTRFLPTVIVQNILLRMKLDLKAIRDKRTNLNAQEIGDDPARAKQWKRYDRNPVFDTDEVQSMVKSGVKTLTEMQVADGGWGWFSGWGERSYPHTTALVVHGLQLAVKNDVALVPGVLDRGVEWLKRYQDEQVQMLKNAPTKTNPWKENADSLDAFVYMVLVDSDVANNDMLEFLYRDRTKIGAYGMALYGLALHKQQQAEKLAMILKNISQFLVEDKENNSAYLKLPNEGYWWYWYGNDIEANAYYLKLLSRTDPQSPAAAGLVKYLLNNRKHSTYWNSTRDTAVCIEALAEYLDKSGEAAPNMVVEIHLDGKKHKQVTIAAADLFTFDNKLVLEGDNITTGEHTLEFKKQGKGPLYWNTYVTYFTLEDFITKAGLEIKVQRQYYKLVREAKSVKVAGSRAQVTDQKVEKYRREPLKNLSTLKSGDLVEIELEIDSKNDYEYLMFEDMKAAGFEPVEVKSGYSGDGLGAYMELRDERVAFFLRSLARGKHSVAYRMRAEIPGKFSALPTRGNGVYAPELRANSDEVKLLIED